MKKTKTILALASALALLMAACVDPTLDSAPDLGNFNDARTNQGYTNNNIKGDNFFPTVTVVGGGNLNATSTDPNTRLVEIDFTTAIAYAKDQHQTIDIMDGGEKLKAAVKFAGVKYPTLDELGEGKYNTYTDLSYTVKDSSGGGIFYVELTGLDTYKAVQPYIKASAYLISGKSIDTNSNHVPGEEPYDNHYYSDLFGIDNNTGYAGGPTPNPPDPLGEFKFNTDTIASPGLGIAGSDAKIILGGTGTSAYKYTSAELAKYIKLEKWNGTSWESAGVTGKSDTANGPFYFEVKYPADTTYDKYRVVAEDLYKFESLEDDGYKHRFKNYPVITEDGGPVLVTAKDAKKVLETISLKTTNYANTHLIGANDLFSSSPSVITDTYGKNAQVILDVDTSKGYSSLGTASASAIKLVYTTKTGSDQNTTVFHTIPIASAAFRVKPGASVNATPLEQQLVITLDPGYVWVNGQDVALYANSGVTFGTVVLGDEKGTEVNFGGNYKWGEYGTFNNLSATTGGATYDEDE
jgi:hypothetical protein